MTEQQKITFGERLRRIVELIPFVTALLEALPRIGKALREVAHNYQELVWLALIALVLYGVFLVMPYIDPRSGIDGFGDMFQVGLVAFKGMAAAFLAWFCKRLYWSDLSREKEERLIDALESGNLRAGYILILDRLETLAWLVFWLFLFFFA